MKQDRIFLIYYYLLFLLVILVFTSIYSFSILRVINVWTYTESHINYSEGFVGRGLFGTVMLFFNKYFSIPIKYFYSTFFYLMSLINIYLFFLLIRQYKRNILIFTFLALNPALILFSFYDLGGYARFEIIAITAMMLNSYYARNFHIKKISEEDYFIYLKYLIIPFLAICIFINEIIIFTIPFHIFLSLEIFKKKYFSNIFIYLLLLIPTYLVYTFKIDQEIALRLFNNLQNNKDLDLWILEAIAVPSLVDRFNIDGSYMLTKGNIIRYSSIFIIFFGPIYIFFNYLRLNRYILIKKNYLCLLSIFPIFFIFLIARDWGRWMHLIIFMTFCFYIQFPIKKNLDINFVKIFKLKYIICIITLFFYLFFIRIPHCCNIEKLQITIYGGAIQKVKVLYDIAFVKNIDINKRFRKNN